MLGLGLPEVLIILVVLLLIFGANKIPQLGDALGKGIRNFKKAAEYGKDGPSGPTSGAQQARQDELPKDAGVAGAPPAAAAEKKI